MLGIIIVDYKSSQRTIQFVKDEICKIKIPHVTVIVSNSATENNTEELKNGLNAQIVKTDCTCESGNSIFILPQSDNLGFAKANNIGAEFLIKEFNCSELLFTNNDIIIDSTETVETLIRKINQDSKIGMIGPEIIGLDHKRQSPEPYQNIWNRYSLPDLCTPFLSRKQKRRIFKFDYSEQATEGFHYRIMGSFFVMKAKDYVNSGGMDPNTFLYAEEMILSERLSKLGKGVYFYPKVRVIHAHGQTTKEHFSTIKGKMLQFDSDAYYYIEYRELSRIQISICRFVYKKILQLKSILK